MTKKSTTTIRYLFLTLTVLNALLIFFLSSQNGGESAETSGSLIESVFGTLFERLNIDLADSEIFTAIDHLIRKLAHFGEYALLGLNIAVFIGTFDKALHFTLAMSVTSGFLYACTDEIHQLFVPERSAQFTDVLIDTLGAATGAVIILAVMRLFKTLRRKKRSFQQ